MAVIRLYQFPAKADPVPADLVYLGDSSDGFNEVNATIENVIGAYPNLLGIGGLTFTANQFPYVDGSGAFTAGVITSAGVGLLAQTTTANQLTYLGALPIAGGTMGGALNMGGFQINNTASPTLGTDVATKSYVDAIAVGGGAPCACATTANLNVTQSGAGVGATLTNAGTQAVFMLDGQTPSVGSRVLVKNQSTQSQNGVYTLTNAGSISTNWVLTRAADYDTPTDINDTGVIPVSAGTVNGGTGWINTTLMVTVDTTAVTFTQFGINYPVSLANGGTGSSLSTVNNAVFVTNSSGVTQLVNGQIPGCTTNTAASTGNIGEFISSEILVGSAVSISTSNTPVDITSIPLTPGRWLMWGNVSINTTVAAATVPGGWINTVSATAPSPPNGGAIFIDQTVTINTGQSFTAPTGNLFKTFSTNTTLYLSTVATFSGATVKAWGGIYALRQS